MTQRKRRASRISILICAAIVSTVLAGCSRGGSAAGTVEVDADQRVAIDGLVEPIVGGGASFPDAFYQAVNSDFNGLAGHEIVGYAKSGSADGRAQLAVGTLDFSGSDSLPSDDERLPDDLLFFPTVAAPITVSYNLPGIEDLSLDGATIAGIFQADITTWDAPEIAATNPGVDLPALSISVVHRSDGSGTTKNFTRFLELAAPGTWRHGSGDEIAWPRSTQGAEKNSGVAEVIRVTRGAIGYVDLGDAAKAGLRPARVGNSAGEFVLPTADATIAALGGVELAADLTFSPLNSPASGAYPITSPTWILLAADQPTGVAESMRTYLRFVLGPAQRSALALGYVPLPDNMVEAARAQIERII